MKETDLLIGKFVACHIDSLSEHELNQLHELLNENDVNLYSWITKKTIPPEKYQHKLMTKLQQFKFSEN